MALPMPESGYEVVYEVEDASTVQLRQELRTLIAAQPRARAHHERLVVFPLATTATTCATIVATGAKEAHARLVCERAERSDALRDRRGWRATLETRMRHHRVPAARRGWWWALAFQHWASIHGVTEGSARAGR